MSDIDLDTTIRPAPRSRLAAALASPAPTALVLAFGFLAVVAAWMPDPRPVTTVVHEVRVGVSTYPAQANAQWRDGAGAVHSLDPWPGQPVRVPARSVVVAVASDGVSCSVTIDGTTVDTATARDGVAVCSWVG